MIEGIAPAIVLDPTRVVTQRYTDDDRRLALDAIHILEEAHRGWGWYVHPQADQGVVDVCSRVLDQHSGKKPWSLVIYKGRTFRGNAPFGYRVKLGTAESPEAWKHAILQAGGELLERFGVPREHFTQDNLALIRKWDDVILEALRDERRM